MNALPIIVGTLCILAIAYRYYSAFIAAKVLALDDSRPVPSQTMYDGHNYYPTNKWVLFGHHFAAISGAGPLIGPVLAAHPRRPTTSSIRASATTFHEKTRDTQANTDRSELGNNVTRYQGGSG